MVEAPPNTEISLKLQVQLVPIDPIVLAYPAVIARFEFAERHEPETAMRPPVQLAVTEAVCPGEVEVT